MNARHALIAAGAVVGLCGVLPALALLLQAFDAAPDDWRLLARWQTLVLVGRSAALAATVATAAMFIGTAAAWLTTRTHLPAQRLCTALFVAPMAFPSYVAAYVWIAALGSGGLLRPVFASLGVDGDAVYGFWPSVVVLSLITYPYVFLTVRSALVRTSPALEEAARTLGRSPTATFFEVVLPQIRPAMWAGGLLAGLYTLSDFGAVSLLRCDSFTEVIYTQFESGLPAAPVALHALLLVGVCVTLVLLERRVRSGPAARASDLSRPVATGVVRAASSVSLPLGRARVLAFGFIAAVGLAGVLVPLAVLLFWIARGGDPSLRPPDLIGLGSTTALVSLLAALVTALAALPAAVLATRGSGRFAGSLEGVAYIGYALPGIVLALALVRFAAPLTWLYQTVGLLVFAYAVHFLPQALGATRASLEQVDPRLEEAARVLGRSPLRAFIEVTLPRIAPGVAAGAALVFLTTMKELPATLVLSPPGFKTLATQIWALTDEGAFAVAARPALALVVLTGVPSVLLVLRSRAAKPLRGRPDDRKGWTA